MLKLFQVFIVSVWFGIFAGPFAHATTAVVIVSSERSPAYVEAAESLMVELERNGVSRYDMLQVTATELPTMGALSPKIFVALGAEAASLLARTEVRIPVLCTLLPRLSFEHLLLASGRKSSAQFSALYLDQPLSRQLELIHLALPNVKNVGVLWSSETQTLAAPFRTLVQASGLELVEATVARPDLLFPSLKKILEDADVLLAVADPQLYNSNSIQNILLSSFRAKIPMIAFSPAYVRAGALLALHVTPVQIGVQTAGLVRGVLAGRAMSAVPLYSQDFSVSVNEHVARSLGLKLDAEALRARLRRREGAP